MGTQLNNGVLTISATYGATVNRGDFNSEKFSFQVGIAFDVQGDSSVAFAEAEAQQKILATQVKVAAIEALGLDGKYDEHGNLLADFGAAPAPQPNVNPVPAQSNGGGQTFKPKADISGNPRFIADLDGQGQTNWIDLRPTKDAGLFSPNAADFRDVNNKTHQVWLKNKDGSVKASVVEALQAAGQPV